MMLATASYPAFADLLVMAPSKVETQKFDPKAATGPGGNAVRAQAGKASSPPLFAGPPPKDQGEPFNDQVLIGPDAKGKSDQAISKDQTTKIGDFVKSVVGGGGGLQRGRSLRYITFLVNDKPPQAPLVIAAFAGAPRQAGPDGLLTEAHSNQSVFKKDGKILNSGLAKTSIANPKKLATPKALALSIVNDPIEFDFEDVSPGDEASIDLTIGNDDALFELVAPDLNGFAAALFEFGVIPSGSFDYIILASFSIMIDHLTAELSPALFQFDAFESAPSLGFDFLDEMDFVTNGLMPFLSFDATAHRLAANGLIPLVSIPVEGTGSTRVLFNSTAFAGFTRANIPEPGSVALFSLGALVIGPLIYRERRRTSRGARTAQRPV
jgi:hypothetical protein